MTAKQLRFESMRHLRPPRPTIQDEQVALKIATRIVGIIVNGDEFLWTGDIDDRIFDVQMEIVRAGRPATVMKRLFEQGRYQYGWEGIDEHCREIGEQIAFEELRKARAAYQSSPADQ